MRIVPDSVLGWAKDVKKAVKQGMPSNAHQSQRETVSERLVMCCRFVKQSTSGRNLLKASQSASHLVISAALLVSKGLLCCVQ